MKYSYPNIFRRFRQFISILFFGCAAWVLLSPCLSEDNIFKLNVTRRESVEIALFSCVIWGISQVILRHASSKRGN